MLKKLLATFFFVSLLYGSIAQTSVILLGTGTPNPDPAHAMTASG